MDRRLKDEAEANLTALAGNKYPGRGFIIGLDEKRENMVQVYFVTGRSVKSRNRVFEKGENGRLYTEIADPSLLDEKDDLSLIIYNAMVEFICLGTRWYVVSNGKQTDSIAKGYGNGRQFYDVMGLWEYEPDPPNFTPRISGIACWHEDKPFVSMALLRKSPWSGKCDQSLFELNDIGHGFGYCLTTYSGDGNPLPSFRGEPYLLPLRGTIGTIAFGLWEKLNHENRVSLAVKFIPKRGPTTTFVINKYQEKV